MIRNPMHFSFKSRIHFNTCDRFLAELIHFGSREAMLLFLYGNPFRPRSAEPIKRSIRSKWRLLYAQTTPSRHGAIYQRDRKSTRLNSSHVKTSYAVFCLKKKTTSKTQ